MMKGGGIRSIVSRWRLDGGRDAYEGWRQSDEYSIRYLHISAGRAGKLEWQYQ